MHRSLKKLIERGESEVMSREPYRILKRTAILVQKKVVWRNEALPFGGIDRDKVNRRNEHMS